MSNINGIYAASMSILNKDLTLNIDKTITHAEMVIDNGCHGVAIFGSTGQAQLIPVAEKIKLLNKISTNNYKDKFIIGTGLNSLGETINLMRVAMSLNLEKFLIMPPAFYKYTDDDVFSFYSKLVEATPKAKIILYNFEKLSGYLFNQDIVKKLVNNFPKQVIGCKDSSYNLFESLKIPNFKMFPGSEAKLLKGLELGCSGCISAVTNVTHSLARKVFDDFEGKKNQTVNEKLVNVRQTFDNYPLISALHSFLNEENKIYKNILPPLTLLNSEKKQELLSNLKKINFIPEKNIAA